MSQQGCRICLLRYPTYLAEKDQKSSRQGGGLHGPPNVLPGELSEGVVTACQCLPTPGISAAAGPGLPATHRGLKGGSCCQSPCVHHVGHAGLHPAALLLTAGVFLASTTCEGTTAVVTQGEQGLVGGGGRGNAFSLLMSVFLLCLGFRV